VSEGAAYVPSPIVSRPEAVRPATAGVKATSHLRSSRHLQSRAAAMLSVLRGVDGIACFQQFGGYDAPSLSGCASFDDSWLDYNRLLLVLIQMGTRDVEGASSGC
jgi:hypothetical protein